MSSTSPSHNETEQTSYTRRRRFNTLDDGSPTNIRKVQIALEWIESTNSRLWNIGAEYYARNVHGPDIASTLSPHPWNWSRDHNILQLHPSGTGSQWLYLQGWIEISCYRYSRACPKVQCVQTRWSRIRNNVSVSSMGRYFRPPTAVYGRSRIDWLPRWLCEPALREYTSRAGTGKWELMLDAQGITCKIEPADSLPLSLFLSFSSSSTSIHTVFSLWAYSYCINLQLGTTARINAIFSPWEYRAMQDTQIQSLSLSCGY